MNLTTPRLTLRAFEAADGPALWAYLKDPQVVRYEPYEPFTRAAAQREARRRAKDPAFIAVCLTQTGRLIGNLYLGACEEGGYSLGYVFHREVWGQGYATEAARGLLAYAFQTLGAHRVSAQCNPKNRASVRVLQRLGMRREGRLRQNISFQRDPATGEPVWQDTLLYALLREEWQAQHALAQP